MTTSIDTRNQALRDALHAMLWRHKASMTNWTQARADAQRDGELDLASSIANTAIAALSGFPIENAIAALAMQEPASEPAESDADWIWWGVVDGQNVVTFGRWPKHGSQRRYKLADIQPTEHDHKPASEPAPACDHRWGGGNDGEYCIKCGTEKSAPAAVPSYCGEDRFFCRTPCEHCKHSGCDAFDEYERRAALRAQPCRCGELQKNRIQKLEAALEKVAQEGSIHGGAWCASVAAHQLGISR